MAHQLESLATKSDDLSFGVETHMVTEGSGSYKLCSDAMHTTA